MKEMKSIGDLDFVRITRSNAFRVIPVRLLEQVKDYEFSIQQLQNLGLSVCSNPLVYIFALIDAEQMIHGVLWCRIDYVDELMDVYLLSVDKEYQGADTLPAVLDFVRELQGKERPKVRALGVKLKEKIRWTTTRPKAFERMGFKRSKAVLMELPYRQVDKEITDESDSQD